MAAVSRQGELVAIRIDLGDHAKGLSAGASVAINGVCLTVTAIDGGQAAFDLIAETQRTTNLGTVRLGDAVNVERSLRIGDEVGGHILSGHVATTCTVVAVDVAAGRHRVTASAPSQWMRYVMNKGFLALNGVSLTVAEIDRNRSTLSVGLIPETLARTTFGNVAVGDAVNMEVDAHTQAAVDTVRTILPEMIRQVPHDRDGDPLLADFQSTQPATGEYQRHHDKRE